MKKAWLVVLGALTVVSFSACNGGTETPFNPGKDPGKQVGDSDECGVIAEQADFERFLNEENGIFKGFLIEGGAVGSCTRTVTVNGSSKTTTKSGYYSFYVSRLPSAKSQLTLENGRLRIEHEYEEFTQELKNAFADKFGVSHDLVKDPIVFGTNMLNPKQILIPGIPILTIDGEYDRDHSYFVIAHESLKSRETQVKSWVEDVNGGKASLRLVFRGSRGNATLVRNLHVPSFSNLNTLDLVQPADLALELWSRTDAISTEYQERERNRAINFATNQGDAIKRVYDSALAEKFAPMAAFARRNWAPSPEVKFETAAQELANLEFVGLFAVGDRQPIQPYYERFKRLQQWFGGDSVGLLQEIKEIVERGSLTPGQEEFVEQVAKKIATSANVHAWRSAKKISRAMDWRQDGIDLVIEVFGGLIGATNRNTDDVLSAAVDFVKVRGIGRSQIPLLVSTLSWLMDGYGPRYQVPSALKFADELIFVRKLETAARLELLKSVYGWLQSYEGPYIRDRGEAMTQAVTLALAPNSSPAFFNTLKSTYAWLVSYEGPYIRDRMSALKKAESFVADTAFNASAFELAQKTFGWLVSYEGPYLRDKSVAYDKTAEFVIKKSMSAAQFQVLSQAFAWLASYEGPYLRDKNQALGKAEGWLFVKGLDAQLLKKLQDSYSTYRRQGLDSQRALAAAEQDVLK